MFEISIMFFLICFVLFTASLGFTTYQRIKTNKLSSNKFEERVHQLNKNCNNLCVLYGVGIGKSSTSTTSKCKGCGGKGAMNCKPCNGQGIDKVHGSVLERWTCKGCKGFGFVPCSSCNSVSKGLTPEQTGER